MNPNALLFVLLGLFWGGSFIAIKFVIAELSPLTGVLLRILIASAALTLVYGVTGRNLGVPKRTRNLVWLAGVFLQALPLTLLFWGEQTVSPGLGGILNGTTPLLTFLIGVLFARLTGERFTVDKLCGLLIGLTGLVVIFWSKLSASAGELRGIAAIFAMAVSYSVGTLINRQVAQATPELDSYAAVYHQHLSATVALLLAAAAKVMFWGDWGGLEHLSQVSPKAWIALFYLSICSNCIAWTIYFHLGRIWGPVRAASVTYILPVVALAGDYLVFGHAPELSQLTGIGFIFLGLLVLSGALKISNLPLFFKPTTR